MIIWGPSLFKLVDNESGRGSGNLNMLDRIMGNEVFFSSITENYGGGLIFEMKIVSKNEI